jgi:hypothetical protein
VVDLIHVLEYVWKAARCFYKEDDPAAESWVLDQALEILDGEADGVAEDIRRRADRDRLDAAKRQAAEQAADYLAHKAPYFDQLPDGAGARLADRGRGHRDGLLILLADTCRAHFRLNHGSRSEGRWVDRPDRERGRAVLIL